MARSFQIYPRGFIGALQADGAAQVAKSVANFDIVRLHSGSRAAGSPKKPPSNQEIDTLYKEYITNSIQAHTFQFYERVLIAAFGAFGTQDFHEWLSAQAQANGTDYLHAKFLKDTVRFISTGRREMLIETWLPMLTTGNDFQNAVSAVSKTDTAFMEMLAEYSKLAPCETDRQLKTVIFEWVRQPNGITDLLKTLYILFGE